MKPTIRELRPSDMDRYADLSETRPQLDRRAAEKRAELVEHMAFHNPHADGNPTYFVIELGDRLMGHLGRMPTLFQIGEERVQASYIHDLYVHDELVKIGQGFFLSMQMYRRAEQASKSFCALIWTNDINIRMQKARKYHQMWAHRYSKLLRADTQLDRRPQFAPFAMVSKPLAAAILQAADTMLSTALGARKKLIEIERFDQRFDRFAEHAGRRMGIGPVKDHRYLNWKYPDRPDLDTAHYVALDGTGEVTGYIVLSVPPSRFHESYILELAVDPEDEKTALALINQAVEHCRRAGAHSLLCLGTDPRLIAALNKLLFVKRPNKLEPLFLANKDRYPRPDVLSELENWNFSFGDSEGTV